MKNKNIFKINIIYFTAITLVAVLFILGYTGILTNDYLTSFLIQIVVMFAIPLLLYTLLISKKTKTTFQDAGFKKISLKALGISILLGVVLYFINTFVADIAYTFISMFGYETLSSSSQVTLNYELLFKEFLLSCILPGFCEEFLHRGIMLLAHKKYNNTRFCLLISSILFGLVHLNIRQFFYAAILGYLMGYVALSADSIFPTIIIHFMNNFLSSYFFYGAYLNWPLASFFTTIEEILLSNIFVFIASTCFGIFLCSIAFIYLTKVLKKERAKRDIKAILNQLKINQLSIEEAQAKINEANTLLHQHFVAENQQEKTKKSKFTDNIFLISSIVLGVLVTISSFIWGIL